mgnify:CR=1 FL=1
MKRSLLMLVVLAACPSTALHSTMVPGLDLRDFVNHNENRQQRGVSLDAALTPGTSEEGTMRLSEASITEEQKARFWSYVASSNECGCRLWLGGTNGKPGYGVTGLNGHRYLAHRLAYWIANGKIIDDLLVCHHCDVPTCCNPEHLFMGTQTDNMRDAVKKGRTASGDRSPSRLHPETRPRGNRHGSKTHPESRPFGEQMTNAKLTVVAVRELRKLAGTISQAELARRFGVSQRTAGKAINGETWNRV